VRSNLTTLLGDRGPLLNVSRGAVTLAGALLGAGTIGWVAHLIPLPFTWRTGIISLAVLERYPKSYETYLYVALVALLPLAALLALFAHAAVTRRHPSAALSDGLAHLVVPAWYLLGWNGSDDLRSVVVTPLLLLVGLRAVLLLVHRGRHAAPEAERPAGRSSDNGFPLLAASLVMLTAVPAGPVLGSSLLKGMPDGAVVMLGTVAAVSGAFLLWGAASWLGARLTGGALRDAMSRDSLTFLTLVPLTLGWFRFDTWQGFVLLAAFLVLKAPAWRLQRPRTASWERMLWALLVPAILYAYLYQPAIARPLDLFEDGVRLAPAGEILRGEKPFTQNFLYHGLFEDAWKSLLSFRLWGVSVAAYARMNNVLAPLGALGAYFLCWSILGSPAGGLALVVCLILLGHEPPDRFACAMGGLAGLVAAIRAGRPRLAVAGGVFLSLAVFQSLESGAGGWGSALLLLALWSAGSDGARKSSMWAGLAIGGIAGALPILTYLSLTGSLTAFIRTSLGLLLPLEDRLSTPFVPQILRGAADLMRHVPLDRQLAKTLMLVAPLPLVVWAVTRLLLLRIQRPWRTQDLGLLAAGIGGFLLYRGVIQRPDTFHLNKMMVFTGLLWGLAFSEARKSWSSGRGRLVAGVAHAALLVPFVLLAVQVAARGPAEALRARLTVASPNMGFCTVPRVGDMSIPPEQAGQIEEIVSYLQQHLKSDDTFFEFSLSGLLYFLANRSNPTPFPHSTFAASSRDQRQAIRLLEHSQPRFVLFPTGRWEQRYEEMGSYLRQPLLARYLYDCYVPSEVVAGFLILRRDSGLDRSGTEAVRSCEWPEVSMGYLPVLYGDPEYQPRGLAVVTRYPAPHIASAWTLAEGRVVTPCDGVFVECVGDARGVQLISPPLRLDPAKVLGVTAGTTAGRLIAEWDTAAPSGRGARRVLCRAAGYAERSHLVELGCVPTWTWSGGITRLSITWPDAGCRVRIREIAFLEDERDPVTGQPRLEGAGQDAALPPTPG
jgi:hypothetical protein